MVETRECVYTPIAADPSAIRSSEPVDIGSAVNSWIFEPYVIVKGAGSVDSGQPVIIIGFRKIPLHTDQGSTGAFHNKTFANQRRGRSRGLTVGDSGARLIEIRFCIIYIVERHTEVVLSDRSRRGKTSERPVRHPSR